MAAAWHLLASSGGLCFRSPTGRPSGPVAAWRTVWGRSSGRHPRSLVPPPGAALREYQLVRQPTRVQPNLTSNALTWAAMWCQTAAGCTGARA